MVDVELDEDEYLKVETVARKLNCSVSSVYREVEKGTLRAVRIGRTVRIPRSALLLFIKQQLEAMER